MVDLPRPTARGLCPVGHTLRAQPPEDGVEVRFPDEEGVVLRQDLPFVVPEVERHAVVERDDVEDAEAERRRAAEDRGEEARGTFRVG